MSATLESLNKKFDKHIKNTTFTFQKIDKRFEQVDKRFEQVEHRLGKIENRLLDLVDKNQLEEFGIKLRKSIVEDIVESFREPFSIIGNTFDNHEKRLVALEKVQ